MNADLSNRSKLLSKTAAYPLGIALLKSDQYGKVKTNLEKAVGHAEPFLERSDDVEIMDFKALALCGLAICNNDKTMQIKQEKHSPARGPSPRPKAMWSAFSSSLI
ncbi:MAG: hypothetical protein PVH87_08020 [Desulfobacteraceae bacterium]|jgi:hypothetical protein